MPQLFFLLEYNLKPLQQPLRILGHSAILPTEKELGLPMNAGDETIVAKVFEQQTNLGLARIIITRDKEFIKHLGVIPLKMLVLTDKTNRMLLSRINLKYLAQAIIKKALDIQNQPGPAIAFIECSHFY